jgi:hypothetical protein
MGAKEGEGEGFTLAQRSIPRWPNLDAAATLWPDNQYLYWDGICVCAKHQSRTFHYPHECTRGKLGHRSERVFVSVLLLLRVGRCRAICCGPSLGLVGCLTVNPHLNKLGVRGCYQWHAYGQALMKKQKISPETPSSLRGRLAPRHGRFARVGPDLAIPPVTHTYPIGCLPDVCRDCERGLDAGLLVASLGMGEAGMNRPSREHLVPVRQRAGAKHPVSTRIPVG